MNTPVISIHQPYAGLIALGIKDIETRTHSNFACLQGKDILIHATKNNKFWYDEDYVNVLLTHPIYSIRGAVIAIAHVEYAGWLTSLDSQRACVRCSSDLFGIFLTNIRRLKDPLYVKGSQGIWYQWVNTNSIEVL